jgi:hypothetical protein
LAVAAGPASPASADPTVTIDSPVDGKVFDTAVVSVSGKADADALSNMKEITLAAGDQSTTVTCTQTPCPFSWSPSLALNGNYDLRVSASEKTVLLGTTGPTTSATRGFGVSAPPKAPTLDPPQVNGDRTVALSWSRNTEGDMLYYAVFRSDPGSTKFNKIGENVKQPTSGGKVTFTDTTTTFAGGDFTYRVAAVRKGVGTAEVSTTSRQATASVPTPPTTTSVAPPGSPQGGPTTTAKPGPPGGVDLNSFLASRGAPKVLTPATTPELPDTGFNQNLPFAPRAPGDDVEPGEPQAAPPGDHVVSVVEQLRGGRPLVPVAAGLILLLLAMHMRLLNRRVKVTGDLPVEPSPDEAAGAGPEGRALPGVTVVGDHDGAEEADELDEEPAPSAGPSRQFYDQLDVADEPAPGWEPEPADEPAPAPEVADDRPSGDDEAWAPPALSDDGWPAPAFDDADDDRVEELDDDDPVPVVVTAGGGRRDWDWDEVEVREVVSPARR